MSRAVLFSFLVVLSTFQTIQANDSQQIKVLAFNAWALRTPIGLELSKDLDVRLPLIPQKICELGVDIVGFQEVWDQSDMQFLVEKLKSCGLNYSAYDESAFHDGPRTSNPLAQILGRTMGNGLLLVSRYPLSNVVLNEPIQKMSFTDATRLDEIVTNKGAIKTRVQLPKLGWIDLFNSHLGAITFDHDTKSYDSGNLDDHYLQAQELAQWYPQVRSRLENIFITDLNLSYFEYHSENGYTNNFSSPYKLMLSLGLRDAFADIRPRRNDILDFTFDSKNPYVSSGYFGHDEAIDFIFINQQSRLKPIQAEIVFNTPYDEIKTNEIPGYLSDHYGVLVTFEITD